VNVIVNMKKVCNENLHLIRKEEGLLFLPHPTHGLQIVKNKNTEYMIYDMIFYKSVRRFFKE
jgi:hypothetical protein